MARNRVYANTSDVVTEYTQLRVPSQIPRTLSRTLGLMRGPSGDLGLGSGNLAQAIQHVAG